MKNSKMQVLAIMVLALATFATLSAHAQTVGAVQPAFHRQSYAVQFANDYARAIDTFQIDGRTFLVQADPKTELEVRTKLYWLEKQKVALMLSQLTTTW